MMSVPPEIEDRHTSFFTASIDVVVALGSQRRPGRDQHAQAGQVVVLARAHAALGDRVDELRRGAEVREALALRVLEEDAAVSREGRAVVEHHGRLGHQRAEEQVPHHPVGGAVVEEAVAGAQVELQLVHLQALQQRAAGAVHDALGLAGGAGGEQDVRGMVERQLREGDVGGLVAAQPFVEPHGLGDVGDVDVRVEVGDHDHLAHGGQLLDDLAHARERVVLLAVVAVAVGAEQDLRLDLAEAVDHALDAEVGGARGPHHALRERGEGEAAPSRGCWG